jgi:hypothetical protein
MNQGSRWDCVIKKTPEVKEAHLSAVNHQLIHRRNVFFRREWPAHTVDAVSERREQNGRNMYSVCMVTIPGSAASNVLLPRLSTVKISILKRIPKNTKKLSSCNSLSYIDSFQI